jgi:hypothetical protein
LAPVRNKSLPLGSALREIVSSKVRTAEFSLFSLLDIFLLLMHKDKNMYNNEKVPQQKIC